MVPAGWDCHVHVFDQRPVQGHYAPRSSTLGAIERAAREIGAGHVVLVQPSVYGNDNALLLKTLRSDPGRHRGIVVLPRGVERRALGAMHDAGVRGVRFNLVSPVGNSEDALPELAPLLAEMGWHVQWHAGPGHLRRIGELHARHGLTAVIDHLAGLSVPPTPRHPSWPDLQRLADLGAWVKVSGLYRLGAQDPYDALAPVIRAAADLFADRLVWGSDWPHTFFAPPAQVPAYASTWGVVPRALGAERARRILEVNPPRLYDR